MWEKFDTCLQKNWNKLAKFLGALRLILIYFGRKLVMNVCAHKDYRYVDALFKGQHCSFSFCILYMLNFLMSLNSVAFKQRVFLFLRNWLFINCCLHIFCLQGKLTPQERLKRKMQAQLNRQCRFLVLNASLCENNDLVIKNCVYVTAVIY